MNRTPPADICRQLREEVNYGCPVNGCGSPFLTLHHFNPTWRVYQHHNPEGMIALCAMHAVMADNDVFTNDHLARLKTNPFIKDRILAEWPWQPENIVFLMGGCIFFEARPILTLRGRRVISASRVQEPHTSIPTIAFDLDLVDPQGNPIVSMEKNILTIHIDNLNNMKCTTGAKEFSFAHISGLRFGIRFDRYSHNEFEDRLSYVTNGDKLIIPDAIRFAQAYSVDSDGKIPVVTITGNLFNSDVTLNIEQNSMELICHFYNNEKVRTKPKWFLPTGKLNIVLEGEEVLRFG
jgi:hypothetical protein